MAIIRWRNQNYPETSLDQLQNEVNKLFHDFLGGDAYPYRSRAYPPVNIYENTNNIHLTAELPGLSAGDIDINVEAENIQIKGERKIEAEGKNGHYHRRERESGTFLKKVSLPTRINTDKVEATVENGVLSVKMSKAEEAMPKKIKVKVG